MSRFHRPSPVLPPLNELVERALCTIDALEAESLVRTIALSAYEEPLRERALLDILKGFCSTNNVVASCLFFLRGLREESLRAGVHIVLGQPDSFESEVPKLCAVVRLVALSHYSENEAQIIADFAFHRSQSIRWGVRRELSALSQDQRRCLVKANAAAADANNHNAHGLQLMLRALPVKND